MNTDDYQTYANSTRNPFTDGPLEQLVFAALELTAEAGEFANLVYKERYQHHPHDAEKLILELGDVMWGIAVAADALGVSLDDVMRANVVKLKKRYPYGRFDMRDSLARADVAPTSPPAPPAPPASVPSAVQGDES